ncbi:MAG: nucleotidyltransferase domain-containing protein [Treponema sp.]|nr:nucleotidyltransferase domain-containing protein [Treponema sp.]
MHKHHEESIKNMTAHYSQNKEITALFLIGSVATGTERPDSDLDGVAIVSQEYYEEKKKKSMECESVFGKCTYENGYFDVHFMTRQHLENLVNNGSEPGRNMFTNAQPLFCHQPDLRELAAKIPIFQKQEAAEKRLRFYCTLKQFYSYFWKICKPEGFARHHVANGMVYNLYRLILIENEILFPSVRKLEMTVINAKNKPEGIVDKCGKFMDTLKDEDAIAIIESYESWTSYNYPKDFQFISNNFSDPWEY